MDVRVYKLDFSWKIEIDGKILATVWMEHGEVSEADIDKINKVIMSLNSENIR